MLCDLCKKNNASVHLVKIVDGKTERISLCIDCFKNLAMFSAEGFLDEIPKILKKVFESDIKMGDKNDTEKLFSEIDNDKDKKCPFCGSDLNSIKNTGRFGCEYCYREFKNIIKPIIKALHGSTKHVGNVPIISGDEIKIEKEIRDLENRLRDEIFVENFEEAAKLRDTIKKLRGRLYVGRKIE